MAIIAPPPTGGHVLFSMFTGTAMHALYSYSKHVTGPKPGPRVLGLKDWDSESWRCCQAPTELSQDCAHPCSTCTSALHVRRWLIEHRSGLNIISQQSLVPTVHFAARAFLVAAADTAEKAPVQTAEPRSRSTTKPCPDMKKMLLCYPNPPPLISTALVRGANFGNGYFQPACVG